MNELPKIENKSVKTEILRHAVTIPLGDFPVILQALGHSIQRGTPVSLEIKGTGLKVTWNTYPKGQVV